MKNIKKFIGLIVLLLLLASQFLPKLTSLVLSASSPWTQSNWAGGSGQTNWSDITKFLSSSLITTSTPNQITLASPEKFTNTNFDSDLSNWSGTQSYAVDDEFSDALVVNPGPGTRTVTDTNSKISVGSGTLNFATGEAANDGVWYGSQTRSNGKLMSGIVTPADTTGIPAVGWDSNTSGAINDALVFNTTTGLQIVPNGGTAILVGAYAGNTAYKIASVLRSTGTYWFIKGGAFTNWSLLWQTAAGTAAASPSIEAQNATSIFTADSVHVPSSLWLPTPIASDGFSASTTDGLGHAEGIAGGLGAGGNGLTRTGGTVSGGTLTISPTTGDEKVVNGNMEAGSPPSSWSAYQATLTSDGTTKHGGAKSIKVAGTSTNNSAYQSISADIGTWYYLNGWIYGDGTNQTRLRLTQSNSPWSSAIIGYQTASVWANAIGVGRAVAQTTYSLFVDNIVNGAVSYGDDVSLKPLTLSSLFSTVPTSTANVIADVTISSLTTGTQAGLVLNVDSTSNPQNFILVYHNGTQLKVEEMVNGAYSATNQSTTVALGAGALRVIREGTKLRVYLNNVIVGSELSMTANTNTTHGIFSTYSGNTFDNFVLWPRGNGGEYSTIPVEDLTITADATHTRGSSAKAAKLVAAGNDSNFFQNVNLGDTNPYDMIAYVYKDGTAISSSDVQFVANGTLITTTYTADADNIGWYKLTGTITGTATSISYGLQVKAGKTLWIDDISLKPQSFSGTLTSSVYDTGQRNTWGNLTYTATTPANTSISVKVITSDTSTISTAFSSCTAISSGSNLSTGGCSSGGRYIQYQITLSTTDITQTPTFSNISVDFTQQNNIYYVSQSIGSDSNDGLTTLTPWKTLSKVNTSTFLPGDQILLKRGDTWRELLNITWSGTARNPIIFGAYGTGDLPKIQTSTSFNNTSDWTNLGNNIWQTNYTGVGGSELLTNTSFDSNTTGWTLYANTGASSTMSQTTTAGEYYSSPGGLKIVNTNNGAVSTDVQFLNSTSLTIQNSKYYELSFYAKSSSAFRVDHISLIQNVAPYTSYNDSNPNPNIGTDWAQYRVFFQATSDATDARITFYLGNVIPDGATLYMDDISLKEFTPSTTIFPGVDVGNISFNNDASFGHKKLTSTADLKTQGDFYYDVNTSNVDLYSTVNPASLYSSIELGLRLISVTLATNTSYVTIKNLHILNTAYLGIGASTGSSNIEVSDNELSNIGGAIQTGTVRFGNAIQFWNGAHDITVERNKIWEVYDAAISNQGTSGDQYNITYKNNVIWNTELGIEIWLMGSGNMYNIYVDNNTISTSGSQSSHVDRSDPRAGAIVFSHGNTANTHDLYVRNNILYGSTQKLIWFGSTFVDISNLIIKNNLFWQPNSTDTVLTWGNTDFSGPNANINNYDLAHLVGSSSGYWQFDKSSIGQSNIVEDPKFTDSSNHNYYIQKDSPAKNAGTTISGVASDFLQNKYYGAPDIGAYEYQEIPAISDAGTPQCTDSAPSGLSPWLYSANANNGNSITLYFANYQSPVDHFALEYGTSPNSYQYAADNIGGKDISSYTINFLSPNTKYYFRIRSGNGCATGTWSNELSATTKGLVTVKNLNIVKSSVVPTETSTEASCQKYTVKSGDTLWKISKNILGNGSKFTEIIEQNKSKYPNISPSSNLKIGWELNVNCSPEVVNSDGGRLVKIKVVDTNKKPIEGAKVTIHSKVQETTTNELGVAEFNNVEPGNHEVFIDYKDFKGKESLNLSGDAKEFDINMTVQQDPLSFSPISMAVIGVLVLAICFLTFKLFKKS